MSLNDGVLDDLPGISEDDDLIKKPRIIQPNGQSATVVAGDAGANAPVLTDEQIDTLASSNVKFNIVLDGVSRVVEMEDVEATIAGNESMNRLDASLIQEVFGQFFVPGRLAMEHFTPLPTKTNFTFSRQFMARRIAAEHMESEAKFRMFFDQVLTATNIALNSVTPETAGRLVDSVEALCTRVKSLNAKGQFDNPSGYFVGRDFIRIDDIDINAINVDVLDIPAELKSVIKNAVKAMTACMDNMVFKSFFFNIVDNGSVDGNFFKAFNGVGLTRPITIGDIIKFYLNADAAGIVSIILKLVEINAQFASEMVEKAKQVAGEFKEIQYFLINNASNVTDFTKIVPRIAAVLVNIPVFTLVSEELIELQTKLQ